MIFSPRDQRARPRVAACRNQRARKLSLADGGQQRLDRTLFGGIRGHHEGGRDRIGWSV